MVLRHQPLHSGVRTTCVGEYPGTSVIAGKPPSSPQSLPVCAPLALLERGSFLGTTAIGQSGNARPGSRKAGALRLRCDALQAAAPVTPPGKHIAGVNAHVCVSSSQTILHRRPRRRYCDRWPPQARPCLPSASSPHPIDVQSSCLGDGALAFASLPANTNSVKQFWIFLIADRRSIMRRMLGYALTLRHNTGICA